MNSNIILPLVSGLLGSFIGGCIAAYGALNAVKQSEFFHLSAYFKSELRDILNVIEKSSVHPVTLIENAELNNAASDVLAFCPPRLRDDFQDKWNNLKYDKKYDGMFPIEYGQNPNEAKQLIQTRINDIITLLNEVDQKNWLLRRLRVIL